MIGTNVEDDVLSVGQSVFVDFPRSSLAACLRDPKSLLCLDHIFDGCIEYSILPLCLAWEAGCVGRS